MSENAKRQKQFERNTKLEVLLQELSGLLGPVEDEVIRVYKEPKYPVLLLVGCARSGTTLILQWLAKTGQFAYPTNFLSRFYAAPYIGAQIQQMLSSPQYSFRDEFSDFGRNISFSSELGKTTGVLAPNEFFYFWRRFFHYEEIQSLDERALKQVDYEKFVAELAALESVFEKPLAMKGLLINWNIPFVARLLPRVFFLFVKRHPIYNGQSLLEAREKFFGNRGSWYSFKPPEYTHLERLDPYEQVAGQVYFTNRGIEMGLDQVDSSKWLQVEYEAFCTSPESIYRQIEEKLALQGVEIRHNYDGPRYFETKNQIRLSEAEFKRVARAYERFCDSDIRAGEYI